MGPARLRADAFLPEGTEGGKQTGSAARFGSRWVAGGTENAKVITHSRLIGWSGGRRRPTGTLFYSLGPVRKTATRS